MKKNKAENVLRGKTFVFKRMCSLINKALVQREKFNLIWTCFQPRF